MKKVNVIPKVSKTFSALIIICIVICTISIIMAVITFINGQVFVNNSISKITSNAKNLNNGSEIIGRIVEIQQSASSEKIIDFLYAFITTILLAVSIYLSRNIQEKHNGIAVMIGSMENQINDDIFLLNLAQQIDYYSVLLISMKNSKNKTEHYNVYLPRIRDILWELNNKLSKCKYVSEICYEQLNNYIQWFQQRINELFSEKEIDQNIHSDLKARSTNIIERIKKIGTKSSEDAF